jgi:hypothetical protein
LPQLSLSASPDRPNQPENEADKDDGRRDLKPQESAKLPQHDLGLRTPVARQDIADTFDRAGAGAKRPSDPFRPVEQCGSQQDQVRMAVPILKLCTPAWCLNPENFGLPSVLVMAAPLAESAVVNQSKVGLKIPYWSNTARQASLRLARCRRRQAVMARTLGISPGQSR